MQIIFQELKAQEAIKINGNNIHLKCLFNKEQFADIKISVEFFKK
jgi:RecB family endonuclease NucS